MPGLINAHTYPIRKGAKFIRLRHTGVSGGSLFLSDLDTPENKRDNEKIPVYVPFRETVDILLTDRTLTSYQQGSIRGFLDGGLLEAFILQNIEVDEGIEQFVPAYDVQADDTLLTVSTDGGDVLVNLPDIFSEPFPQERTPEGTRITIKKTSLDGNSVLITAPVGNTIEGVPGTYALSDALGAVTLQADGLGNWWVLTNAAAAGGGQELSVLTLTSDIAVPAGAGRLYLKAGTVVTSSAPWVAPAAGTFSAVGVSLDATDTQDYTVDLFVNQVLMTSVPIPAGVQSLTQAVMIPLITGQRVQVQVRRTSGSSKSLFENIVVTVQMTAA